MSDIFPSSIFFDDTYFFNFLVKISSKTFISSTYLIWLSSTSRAAICVQIADPLTIQSDGSMVTDQYQHAGHPQRFIALAIPNCQFIGSKILLLEHNIRCIGPWFKRHDGISSVFPRLTKYILEFALV